MGKAKNNKVKNSALKKTTTPTLPNSQKPGQICEPENKHQTPTPGKTTPFSTAGNQDEFDFGNVVPILGGAKNKTHPTETTKTTTPFSTAGIPDELELRGTTFFFAGAKKTQLKHRRPRLHSQLQAIKKN